MLAASLPSCSLRLNNDNSLSVLRVKTNTGARAFHSCAPSPWNNLLLSDLAFPPQIPAYPMACWCYGTVSSILLLNLIWLLHHWAWLRRGYWRYRNLIDWLIYHALFKPFPAVSNTFIPSVVIMSTNIWISCYWQFMREWEYLLFIVYIVVRNEHRHLFFYH